jgi:hypothetical protein
MKLEKMIINDAKNLKTLFLLGQQISNNKEFDDNFLIQEIIIPSNWNDQVEMTRYIRKNNL